MSYSVPTKKELPSEENTQLKKERYSSVLPAFPDHPSTLPWNDAAKGRGACTGGAWSKSRKSSFGAFIFEFDLRQRVLVDDEA